MSQTRISRRRFLKLGCISLGVMGMSACGLSTIAGDPPAIEQSSYQFGEKNMKERLLIAYATYAGSTAEVAAAIGQTLAEEGYAVDVKPIQEDPDLDGYQAALVGSAVQYGQWLPEATAFVRANQAALKRIPVALFCVHIRNLGDDEESIRNRLAYLDPVRPQLQPVAEGYFAGKFDRRGAVLLLPRFFGRLMPPVDLRKWDMIETWARSISPKIHHQLKRKAVAAGMPTTLQS